MAEGNWVKPGTEPWPPHGENTRVAVAVAWEQAAERMGEYGLYGDQPQLSFELCSAAVTNISLAVILKTEWWLP